MTTNNKRDRDKLPESIKLMAKEADAIHQLLVMESIGQDSRLSERSIELVRIRAQFLQAQALIHLTTQLEKFLIPLAEAMKKSVSNPVSKVPGRAWEDRSVTSDKKLDKKKEDKAWPESIPKKIEDDVFFALEKAGDVGLRNNEMAKMLRLDWREVKVACMQLREKKLIKTEGDYPKIRWVITKTKE